MIGFGLAGQVFHAPFVSAVPGLKLEAIVQRTGDTAGRLPFGADSAVGRGGDAASGVRLVVVGTPNETHFDLAKQALQAGKHVVIDKPFAATSAQAAELMDLAEKQGWAGSVS